MLKLTFIADTHHYSKTLGTTGRQYELRSGSDQKCLAETGDIIDAAFKQIADSDTQAVLIAGDVSNDGEMVSHLEFRKKLYELKKKKPVYLITATHDWCCDRNPRRFNGDTVTNDVEVMPSYKLPEFYSDFGLNRSIAHYITHIGTCSYVLQLSKNVRLLALNDDKNGNDGAGFTPEHFDWIEKQIKKAADDNCILIGMEHHLLTPHISPLITGGGTCVAEREYVASRLADARLKYMFVGHSHIQNTTDYKSPSGNVIKEVNVGSLCGYPSPIVNVTVFDDGKIYYEVDHLKSFRLDGEMIDAQTFLANHATQLVHRVIECRDKNEFADRMTALQTNGGKIAKLFFIVEPVLKFVGEKTVIEAYSFLKHFGISHFISLSLIMPFRNKKIMDIVDEILLSALDGSRTVYKRESDYYKMIMEFVSIPSKIFKKNTDFKKLIFAVDAILTGGRFDNQKGYL
ncbi:MAG: metallophosphoesterase [Clostridiales bacterium]|nr:metallophosphoesterase [Clostridiales bacterium]